MLCLKLRFLLLRKKGKRNIGSFLFSYKSKLALEIGYFILKDKILEYQREKAQVAEACVRSLALREHPEPLGVTAEHSGGTDPQALSNVVQKRAK